MGLEAFTSACLVLTDIVFTKFIQTIEISVPHRLVLVKDAHDTTAIA